MEWSRGLARPHAGCLHKPRLVSFLLFATCDHLRERTPVVRKQRLSVIVPLSFAARRQVIERMVPFYREASLLRKRSCWIKVVEDPRQIVLLSL